MLLFGCCRHPGGWSFRKRQGRLSQTRSLWAERPVPSRGVSEAARVWTHGKRMRACGGREAARAAATYSGFSAAKLWEYCRLGGALPDLGSARAAYSNLAAQTRMVSAGEFYASLAKIMKIFQRLLKQRARARIFEFESRMPISVSCGGRPPSTLGLEIVPFKVRQGRVIEPAFAAFKGRREVSRLRKTGKQLAGGPGTAVHDTISILLEAAGAQRAI